MESTGVPSKQRYNAADEPIYSIDVKASSIKCYLAYAYLGEIDDIAR